MRSEILEGGSLESRRNRSDKEILFFIIVLCFVAGFLLAVVSFSLQTPQAKAKAFDQNKQMLIAAKILSHDDRFELIQEGKILPARFDPNKEILVPVEKANPATDEEIKTIANLRIRPLLTNDQGELFTFKSKNIPLESYLAENKKTGYAKLPLKLFYAILPNDSKAKEITEEAIVKDPTLIESFVIPISGYGLWAPIYGYLAVEKNGEEVIGTTWYEMAETPGLGANIAQEPWQKQFYSKLIFQQDAEGKVDFTTAPLGITVVKGSVKDVLGTSPKAKSAVDGMSGATLTGNGVTAAYFDSLAPYRNFLSKLHDLNKEKKK